MDAGCLRYQVDNVYMGLTDGDAIIDALEAKRAAAGGLDPGATLDIGLTVPMGHPRRTAVEAAVAALDLAAALTDVAVRGGCQGAVLGLANLCLSRVEFEAFLEVEQVAKTPLDELLEERWNKGKAEGRAEGRTEDLLFLLRERFGDVPRPLAKRIGREQDPAVLERWLVTALRAPSLKAFADCLDGQS